MFQPFSYILVPIDFSEHSLLALRLADTMARGFGAELHLVHVVERSPYEYYAAQGFMPEIPPFPVVNGQLMDLDALKANMKDRLAKLAEAGRGGPCTVEVRYGHPVEEILAAAKERDCNLMVICTHGRTGLSRLVMGSVAERIVRLSPIPVLSVRGQGIKD